MALSHLVVWGFRISCLLIAALTLRVLLAPLAIVMPAMAPYWPALRFAVLAHIIFAPLALGLAPLQLATGLRRRYPRFHRICGYAYALSILVAGLAALVLAAHFGGTTWAQMGFVALGICWIGATAIAVHKARSRDFAAHRIWMLRSVAMTFGAVTLRLYMAPMMAMGMNYLDTYNVTAWGAWVPNLLILEFFLRRRRKQPA